MQIGTYISLQRQFSPVPKNQEDAENDEILSHWGTADFKAWGDLDNEYRSVILAEAGSGKTEELRQRASDLDSQGRPSFFIRIEDIEADFCSAFEIGNETKFRSWLESTGEAWFFLDSVDEARLDNPRKFETALRRFAKGIVNGAHRAHIYLSSRPYSWRSHQDRKLMDEILYLPSPRDDEDNEEAGQSKPQSALTIYTMLPLDEEKIRCFCLARQTHNIDGLLREIERTNLWSLAERPFDLEGVISKWNDDESLGGRMELLRHNIDKRLRDDHDSDRAQRQPLNLERARDGARRLAAAVVLTGQSGINVPDATSTTTGIDAESILADWDPKDVRALLERGIFNGIIFDAVRFRHRDVRELLAAEWFDELLKSGNSRRSVKSLFFCEQYGENIVKPRLRPILPWLILFDDEIRRRALNISPEIAVQGGDPSQLPLSERRNILNNIVSRIVSSDDDRSARDNSAIARIATPDLTEDTQRLIDEYGDNDDAIFFLGRLVWQGEMADCLAPLVSIAVDHSREIYARIASTRAVMTCGTIEQQQSLWGQLNGSNEKISRRLLAELIQYTVPDSDIVDKLLVSIGKLQPYKRFKTTGLDRGIRAFVEGLAIANNQQIVNQFLDGLHSYLERSPYVERLECRVSEEYAWLLSPATHMVERLVKVRNSIALENTALSILLMVPALRYWRDYDLSEHKDNLRELVPNWPELNDALYWASIEQMRADKDQSDEELTDDWPVSWVGHFWAFDEMSLPRLCDYMHSRLLHDDKLVALSTALRVYPNAKKPAEVLNMLQDAVVNDVVLQQQLNAQLNPPVSEAAQSNQAARVERRRERDEEKNRKKQDREAWISELRANPDRIRNPSGVNSREFTNDHSWLMGEIRGQSLLDYGGFTDWKELIQDFGGEVAQAYRDAAIEHWQYYVPPLRSEGHQGNGTPYELIFAMAGLEIDVNENAEFPHNLDEKKARHALRYISWQLNGFPSWFERIYRAFPNLAEEAVIKELVWELENTATDKPMHYILCDLAYHAPWLHAAMAPVILEWTKANPARINANRHFCLDILVKGGTGATALAELASLELVQDNDLDSHAVWYAIRVDCAPELGIREVEEWLSSLDECEAIHAAQVFITTLMGGRHIDMGGPYIGNFRTVEHLKLLYILMHNYIRAEEDINRANGGVFSPELRDDAQDARNGLFSHLLEISGKASYTAIKQLTNEHPDPNYRLWMAKHAYKKAEQDGDHKPWTAEQVRKFGETQILKPETHRQLYELTIKRLYDLKNWLELGNDSPYKTWQRAEDETETRNLIAGWLNQQRQDRYMTAQEPELANSQRMDIWLQNDNAGSPVPIELKLLDKSWSGPKLCERLRNQLAGDYLREEGGGCGVMLLVWQGRKTEKRWKINNRLVELSELADALKEYWMSIADQFNNVEAIEIIVIDLSVRGQLSNS